MRRLASTACVLLVALACSICVAEDIDEAATASELKQIVSELNALGDWLDDAGKRQAKLQSELKAQDQAVSQVTRDVRTTDAALSATQVEIASLEVERNELSVVRAKQAQRIAQHVNAAYRLQGQDVVKALLNQESPSDFERMLRYHRYFSDARLEALRGYQQTLLKIDSNQQELNQERARLTDTRATLAARKVALESQRGERADLIARLAREVTSKTARAEKLREDRARLEALVQELARRKQELDGADFAARRGRLTAPSGGHLIYQYGESRADGRLRWEGMVYRTDAGAAVHAVHRGRVVFADWLRGFGLLTIIDHGSGYMTLYGYTDDLSKTVGDWVESGEVIAHAGQSGGQAFDGVYFEIRQKTSTLDPRPWLNRAAK